MLLHEQLYKRKRQLINHLIDSLFFYLVLPFSLLWSGLTRTCLRIYFLFIRRVQLRSCLNDFSLLLTLDHSTEGALVLLEWSKSGNIFVVVCGNIWDSNSWSDGTLDEFFWKSDHWCLLLWILLFLFHFVRKPPIEGSLIKFLT